ncbi:hypothetical protein [Metabacillus arenae]|uniref:DNA primase n=1 Tax=Metabacillus arenae TaxID=2771434 RepID=A0A926NDE4_9BACI|nr:hypothetical protein [Metabacillus arenae]MBD1379090.1 hypothetical protein [Metabacillus arenae]
MIELKKRLMNNPHHIESILEEYDFHNVKVGTREIRCSIDEEGNATSIRIKLNENLTSNDFARDIYGDLFSLIMKCKKVELKEIIRTVKKELGISYIDFNKNKKIFGGFYDNIRKRNNSRIELKPYEEDVLNEYINKYNTLFLKDGINLLTQKKFKLGICHSTSRIVVPWYSYEGSLIGIEGRYMGNHEKDEVPKWFPLIAFPKSQALFGYYNNYEYLQSTEDIYVGESSKFVMQLDSWGIHKGVALGGKAIHNEQIKQLSWLNPKRIILCFDEGLEEELIINQVNKAKVLLKFFNMEVGYVSDKENKILSKGSKNSPTDVGLDKFKELIENYVVWG